MCNIQQYVRIEKFFPCSKVY